MKLFSDHLPFYKANFHTHTTMSDGKKTPEECIAPYRGLGYDILALTDHRKVTRVAPAPEGILMMPGIELDFMLPTQAVHLIGLGMTDEIAADFDPKGTPQQAIDSICSRGGRAILAHPAWSLNAPEYMASLQRVTAAEVWNSVSTIPYNAMRPDSSSLLDVTSSLGRLLPLVASDDTHFYGSDVAQGYTMVQAEELTVPAVLRALDAGRFYASQGPEIHQIEWDENTVRIACSSAETIIFYSARPWVNKRSFCGHDLTKAEYAIQPGDRFVRCQIIDQNGKSAWASPIRVE